MTEALAEKIRLVLIAKRKNLLSRRYLETSEDESTLVEWVQLQDSYGMPLDGISDEFKIKIAKTLINLYGDKILREMYSDDDNLSQVERYEKMLDEILLQNKVRTINQLKKGVMFGE